MAKKDEFFTTVKGGKLKPTTTKAILAVLPKYEDKKVKVTIEQLSSKRSAEQNRYIHLLFTIFKDALNELGNDYRMERVKEICKFKFALKDEVNEQTGEVIGKYIQKTSDMTKMEMCTFVDNVIMWAADNFHIVLPLPGENIKMSFGND